MKSSIRITNKGNTIRASGEAAEALFAALTEPMKKQARHTHVNNGADDNCKDCGKDLRDKIHFRHGDSVIEKRAAEYVHTLTGEKHENLPKM